MFIAYNIIFHAPVVAVNLAIIAKECQLPFFQLIADKKRPEHADEINLSLIDYEDSFKLLLNLLNPTFLTRVWSKFTFGFDPIDVIM